MKKAEDEGEIMTEDKESLRHDHGSSFIVIGIFFHGCQPLQPCHNSYKYLITFFSIDSV